MADLPVPHSPPLQTPSLWAFFLTSFNIGLFSVGGGMTGWMFREYVTRLRWLNESDFLNELAVARVLPGTNVTNLTVMVGFRLLGVAGAVAGFVGLLFGPFCLLMVIFRTYDQIKGPLLDSLMQGAAAGALGPVVYLTYRSVLHGGSRWYLALIVCAVTVGTILKIPLLLVVAAALPASMSLVWIFWKP